MDFLNYGINVLSPSYPVTSTNFPAVFVTPCLTSLFSSSKSSMICGRSFETACSFGRRVHIMEITSVTPVLTYGTESFARYCKWGTIITSFSGDSILINFVSDSIDAIRTSFSASRKRFVKIWINDTLSASSPNASAISAKIFDKASLTRHDLSSVAAMMIGSVNCLFSSFLRTFATSFKDYNPRTLTMSYSSEINYLILWIRSVMTNSFSMNWAKS